MKRKIVVRQNGKQLEREINYIPVRYIIAALLIVLEIAAVLLTMILLSLYIPYFWLAELVTQLVCVISLIGRSDNPDYKLPWLLFVMAVPIAGFMCYLMLYSRKLSRRQHKQLARVRNIKILKDNTAVLAAMEDPFAASEGLLLGKLAGCNVYRNTDVRYLPSGERYFLSLLSDLKNAARFIFLEYFIIEQGLFWNSVLEVLRERAASGVQVAVLYDDIGCMSTLPGNYEKVLASYGIHAHPFARLRGQATNEFNNRNHRKITVIDGKVGYTGGINLADEYINHVERFGHWKDVGVRLEGEAVGELTRLFLQDFEMSARRPLFEPEKYLCTHSVPDEGFCIPFGDGPKPLYERQVSKRLILGMLGRAERYVYITTPYLIVDNETVQAIENAALRGVDVRVLTPHIPDKKLVFMMTRSSYARLIAAVVKILEYEPGFLHAKVYLSDDKYAMVGTVNLDYRSLVHHFENGVWLYRHRVIEDIKADFAETEAKSLAVAQNQYEGGLFRRLAVALLKVLAPLL